MLLEFLSCAILPEQITKENSGALKSVLTPIILSLKKNTDWLGAFSMKHFFCWSVLATCCSKISISCDDLSWAHHCASSVDTLCEVLFYVCTKIDMPVLLADSIPDLIQRHPSKDLRRYVACFIAYPVSVHLVHVDQLCEVDIAK
jgi:hypothetical protein